MDEPNLPSNDGASSPCSISTKMPRYFFHFYDDGRLCTRNLELADLATALEECVRIMRQLPSRKTGEDTSGPKLRLADETGRTIITVPLGALPQF